MNFTQSARTISSIKGFSSPHGEGTSLVVDRATRALFCAALLPHFCGHAGRLTSGRADRVALIRLSITLAAARRHLLTITDRFGGTARRGTTFSTQFAALLLIVKPRMGIGLTVVIMVSDVVHNAYYVATSNQWLSPFYLAQVGFLVAVLGLARTAARECSSTRRVRV